MQNKHKRLILLHGTGRYNPLRTKYKYSKHRDIYRDLVGHFEKHLTSENVFKIFNNQWRCDNSQFIGWFADQLSQSNICVRNVLFPSPYQIITFIVRPYIKSSRIIVRHAILFFIASYYTHRKPIFRLYIYITYTSQQLCSCMMTSSNGNFIRVTGPLCVEFTGEFPSQRPATRSFHVFVDLRLNKRLSKQSRRRWFETPSRSLYRLCNGHSLVIGHSLVSLRVNFNKTHRFTIYSNAKQCMLYFQNSLAK